MKIELTTLLEIDLDAEAERLRRNFRGADRKAQLAILESFAAGRFNDAIGGLAALNRGQLECVHPVIDKVLRGAVDRVNRVAALKKFDFSKLPEHERMAGGVYGNPVSATGLEYPKVRILPS